jgi:prepilin-type N-terminal cleavage/methylation domain-containing protein
MKNYMDALKRRKEETGESGFSLIELIVVVVILGVLAAIAVPVFLGLQGNAEVSARETVAANGASQAAAEIAKSTTALTTVDLDNLEDGKYNITITPKTGTTLSLDNFCVTAAKIGGATGDTSSSGPGCS